MTDDQLTNPTPCPTYPVAALLDHLMGLSSAFTWAARKTTATERGGESGPGLATAEHLDPEWRTLLPQRLPEQAAAREGLFGPVVDVPRMLPRSTARSASLAATLPGRHDTLTDRGPSGSAVAQFRRLVE